MGAAPIERQQTAIGRAKWDRIERPVFRLDVSVDHLRGKRR